MEARTLLHPSPGSPFPCIQGTEGVCTYYCSPTSGHLEVANGTETASVGDKNPAQVGGKEGGWAPGRTFSEGGARVAAGGL